MILMEPNSLRKENCASNGTITTLIVKSTTSI